MVPPPFFYAIFCIFSIKRGSRSHALRGSGQFGALRRGTQSVHKHSHAERGNETPDY